MFLSRSVKLATRRYALPASLKSSVSVCCLGILHNMSPFCLLLLGTSAAVTGQKNSVVPVKIGSAVQLLLDDYLIDSMNGVVLKLHSPQSAGVAIAFDRPWEGNTSAYVTVFTDEMKYRMYYRGSSDPKDVMTSSLRPGEKVFPQHEEVTCYAESADGITWHKPSVNLFTFDGSADNNIIWKGEGAHNFSPFKDANPEAPASERYKAVAWSPNSPGRGLIAFKSGDAIHWTRLREKPIMTDGGFDSLNVVFWDKKRQLYILIFRDAVLGSRTLKSSTSKDFLTWTTSEYADFGSAPIEQLYTSAATPYFLAPEIYLAFPMRFVPWRRPYDGVPESGISDTVFMTSRDGIHWDRRFLEAIVRPGRDRRDWFHRNRMAATGVVPTGPAELSIYVSRHYNFPSAFLERMTFRTDGFVSVHAGYKAGEFITRPLIIDGNYLVLNYATSAIGGIRYEIEDINRNPLPGYGFEETKLLYGDKTEDIIRLQDPDKRREWPGRGLEARPVRLHFVMNDADLYSIQIRE